MNYWNKFKKIVSYIPGTVWLYQRIMGLVTGNAGPGAVPRLKLERGALPKHDPDKIKNDYACSSLATEPDTFVLYRIIGNDLFPRHRKGQSRDNLKFILENEPTLRGCEKRFVINRIVDRNEEEAIISMLRESGYAYLHIPFCLEEYQELPWDILGVPSEYAPFTQKFSALSPAEQGRVLMRLYRHKNNYVMNNNGARNAALNEGRSLAKWVLPWDGNCFITARAWKDISATVSSAPELPYFIVPMARITDNQLLLNPAYQPEAAEEPQIILRRDCSLSFNEEYYYGRRPKVELLWRLGVPGDWDRWQLEPWDLPGPKYTPQAGCFSSAGWVARLSSGQARLETDPVNGKVDRGLARNQAISGLLDHLDARILSARDFNQPLILNCTVIPENFRNTAREKLLSGLLQTSEEALQRGPFSVIDKSTLAPSKDLHDYWHPAPYYWPNPLTPSGLPYVSRDGQRVPGTRLYEPESDKYDRTRLQRLFDDTLVLAMAWRYSGRKKYAEHSAGLIRTWFIKSETAMNPNLKYAQVRMGHNNNLGSNSGLIEMKDLYFFLDALRILQNDGFLVQDEQNRLKQWFKSYLNWLRTSPQGIKERSTLNNHGLYYDLQVASIAAFLGESLLVRDTLRDSRFRILKHFAPDGSQPEELKRTTTAHYCCFNLQGWIHLAQLAETCGEDLWSFEGRDGRGIKKGMYWLLTHMDKDWPYQQIDEFDNERFYPIYYACKARYGLPDSLQDLYVPKPYAIKPLFYPHDGIRPFWQLGLKQLY